MKPNNWSNIELKQSSFLKLYYLLFVLILILRVTFAYSWRIDSDEPQHLHVVWSWSNGLLQYRDLFDNHTPLFHMIFSPIYRIFGERPDILIMMRLSEMPLFFLSLWAIFMIGKSLYSKQVGIWATIITALCSSFFLTSLEFRTDNLWMALWLMALAILIHKPLKISHIFLVGLLLGAALGASMKTTLLLSALGPASLIAHILIRSPTQISLKTYLSNSVIFIVGLALIPTVLILFFAYNNALSPMYYSVIQHNIVPGLTKSRSIGMILSMSLLTISGTYFITRFSDDVGLLQRRLIVFLTYGISMIGLYSFWPLITAQDFLPLTPLLIISSTGLLLEVLALKQSVTKPSKHHWVTKHHWVMTIPITIVILELGFLVVKEKPWNNKTLDEKHLEAEVLQLTHPGDTIMDLKGETIFRKRGFFYVLEGVTRKRIALGLIKDTIPEDILTKKTYVAVADSKNFPPVGRAFLNQNFLLVGDLRVAGKLLPVASKTANNEIGFDVSIPASYIVTSDHVIVNGLLDGTIYNGARQLNVGHHTYLPKTSGNDQLAIVWAPAIERGFFTFLSFNIHQNTPFIVKPNKIG